MFLSLIIVSIVVGCKATDCPDGWLAYEGSCYLIGADDVHYTEAEHFCMQHNSHLVHVQSAEENNFLKGYFKTFVNGHNYWLGMTDDISEGLWKWNGNDERVEFFNWAPTEPQDSNNEDCAVFHMSLNFQWADVQCKSDRRPICEKRETTDVIVG
ncbi:C-type lectin domain 10 [Mactra antiquata]